MSIKNPRCIRIPYLPVGKFKHKLGKNRRCERMRASLQCTCRLAKRRHEFLMERERRHHMCAQMLELARRLRSNSAMLRVLAARKQGRGRAIAARENLDG